MKYKTVVIDHLNCLFSNEMYIPDCCVSFAFRCMIEKYKYKNKSDYLMSLVYKFMWAGMFAFCFWRVMIAL